MCDNGRSSRSRSNTVNQETDDGENTESPTASPHSPEDASTTATEANNPHYCIKDCKHEHSNTGDMIRCCLCYQWCHEDCVKRIQNLLARIICDNFDYIHSRGIDLVKSLKLQTTRQRRDYFLCVLMFKCIHGLAPHYLSNDVTMHVDIHGYDTRSAENMDLYIPRCAKEIYKRSFLYKGSSLWNKLPPWVKESTSLNDFKHNYRLLNG